MNVLLVHGFWDLGRVFRRLQLRLEADGHKCFAPSLSPRDARHGIPDLAEKLADYVDRSIAPDKPLAVIGFSMGCLVAQYYLVSPRINRPVNAFFAISGPMHGSLTAWLYPGKGTRDMRPGSEFLRQLTARRNIASLLPVFTYFTPLDLMIVPASSSRIPNARERLVWSPLHRAMLWSPSVAHDICKHLRSL